MSFSEIEEMKCLLVEFGEPEVTLGYIIIGHNQL